MSSTLSLPMYDVHRPDSQALWSALLPLLRAEGLAAERLDIVWPSEDLLAHWRDGRLLLSQTCGYPLVTQLPEVQPVGCFHYTAPGCDGVNYRSFLVVRTQDAGSTLEDFRGRRAVCNSIDSQSGYNALRHEVAPRAKHGRFFAEVILSGSHRQSLAAVQRGEADIAAIDCVTWALLKRHEPLAVLSLAVIGHTPLSPGLPLITSSQTSPEDLSAQRKVLSQLVTDSSYVAVCEKLFIGGFSQISREDYDVILDWQREAMEFGVLDL